MNSVSKLRMTATIAEKTIRKIAADSTKVIKTTHAIERMEERGLDDRDLFEILRKGYVDSDPVLGRKNCWECRVTKKLRENRDVTAITAFTDEKGNLIIITVMWEDL